MGKKSQLSDSSCLGSSYVILAFLVSTRSCCFSFQAFPSSSIPRAPAMYVSQTPLQLHYPWGKNIYSWTCMTCIHKCVVCICVRLYLVQMAGLVVKNPPADAGDARNAGSIPGSGRFPGGGHGSPLQHSCLENPMDRGARRATVYGVAQSWTQLRD